MKRLAPIVLGLSVIVLGCVGTRGPVDCNMANQLQEGIATPRDAVALLGKPTSISSGNGVTAYQWGGRATKMKGGGNPTVLTLYFGPDARLKDKTCNSDSQDGAPQRPAVKKAKPGLGALLAN